MEIWAYGVKCSIYNEVKIKTMTASNTLVVLYREVPYTAKYSGAYIETSSVRVNLDNNSFHLYTTTHINMCMSI